VTHGGASTLATVRRSDRACRFPAHGFDEDVGFQEVREGINPTMLTSPTCTPDDAIPQLALSEHTIRDHLLRIYDKLGISSRVELVLHAVSGTDSAPVPANE
jgi:Bacterial regulatory proteins, luxR family